MANWQHRIELKDLHEKYEDGEITIQEVAKQLKSRLEILYGAINKRRYLAKDIYLEMLKTITTDFEALSEDENASVDNYDDVLSSLYDFGDIKLDNKDIFHEARLCWINTF